MHTTPPFDRLSHWVRSLLLTYRNAHNEAFLERYNRRSLRDLSIYELEKLYREVVEEDKAQIGFIMQQIETEESHRTKNGK